MVIYRGVDGKPGYHQTDDIHDAVGFVEQMRNEEGVQHARIFRLEEVVFEYRPYYRVELSKAAAAAALGGVSMGLDDPASPPLPPSELAATALAAEGQQRESIELVEDVIAVVDGHDDAVRAESAMGKKGLFGR